MSRTRLNIFLQPDHAKRLAEFAALKGLSKSSIIAAALASTLSPDSADQREAATSRRLDRLTRQFDKLEQDQNIAIETLALFIKYYLSVTPVVPEAQQIAAWAQGRGRFAQFVEQLGRQLQRGKSLVRDLHEEIYPEDRDFFSFDDGASGPKSEAEV
jgi:hypothetical protein